MRIPDEQLDFWADRFCELGLARYLTFSSFIQQPTQHLQRILDGAQRPLLRRQLRVRERLAQLGRYDLIERLERDDRAALDAVCQGEAHDV